DAYESMLQSDKAIIWHARAYQNNLLRHSSGCSSNAKRMSSAHPALQGQSPESLVKPKETGVVCHRKRK
ncbi:hypothetical protein P7K49_016809, partial [Saguinus oedipus]